MGLPWRTSHYVAAGALAAGALLWGTHEAWSGRRPLTARPLVITRAYDEFADTLHRNETLSDVLSRAGITGRAYTAFLAAATGIPARRLQPGLVFEFRRLKGDSVTQRVMVRTAPESRIAVSRRGGDSGWVQFVESIPWTVTRLRAMGTIESSLYDALDRAISDSFLPLGQRRQLAWEIADVYDWEVDFTHDLRPGDRFDVLIERLESSEGERRFGRILAARVDVAHTPSYAFYFEADGGVRGFYDEQGRSLRRAFLRAPLEFRRVSSRFGGRYHPILKQWRSHQGTDYAAGYGTPVRATADGVVTKAGREGGYGNLVELRHGNGIRTRYGHLSAFGRGVFIGARVKQGEWVGYVGATGLATGPHLHYEFIVNGRPTNPQRKDAGPVLKVPDRLRAAFDTLRGQLLVELEPHSTTPAVPAVAATVH
jgi:murein DD-endopeptidase MepM/ murein hydrolase activator NlpD